MAIDTTFTPEGEAFRASMRRFFAENSPLDAQRITNVPALELPTYWSQLAELDLLSIGVESPEDTSTMSLADVFPLYLEMGRVLAMSPHLNTAMLVLPVIVQSDIDQTHSQLVIELSGGNSVVAFALHERAVSGPLEVLETRADKTENGWRIFGEKVFVQYANVASHILVPARTNDEGLTLFLVPKNDAAITYMDNASNVPIFHVVLDGVEVPDALRVGAIGAAASVLRSAIDRAEILRCVEIVGAGEKILELCLDYAKVRKQFGTAIGSFQAVQYLCTDIAIMTRVTFLLALQCAVKVDHHEDYVHELSALRHYAKRACSVIVGRAQEVHAGVAFMEEYDLHLFTRRSLYWLSELGDDAEIADALLGYEGSAGI